MTTGTTVSLQSRGSQGGVTWLELSYDGLAPPTALFDDLAMIGWQPPVPAPPPRSAVDWSTPDEATGQRFTIRPYRVTDQRVDPPAGTGSRGQWTPDERRAFLHTLEGVLRRHGLALDGSTPPAPASDAATLPPPPAPAPADVAAPAAPPPVDLDALPPPPLAAGDRAGTTASTPEGVDPEGFYRVVAPLPRGVRRAELEAGAERAGLGLSWERLTRTVTTRFRGSVAEDEVVVPAVAVLCDGGRVDDAVELLADLGIVAGVDGVELQPVTGDALARALQAPAAGRAGLARVIVVTDPPRAPEVVAALEAAGAVEVDTARTRRMVEQRFRGSVAETAVPAIRVRAAVDSASATRLASVAATAAGVAVSDVQIEAAPTAEPTGPEPAPSADSSGAAASDDPEEDADGAGGVRATHAPDATHAPAATDEDGALVA